MGLIPKTSFLHLFLSPVHWWALSVLTSEHTALSPPSSWPTAAASCEERPCIQAKRNPGKTVGTERGEQGADRLKLQSRTTSQSDHTDHSLVYLSETKPCPWSHPRQAGHGGGLTECGPLEKGMANHFSIPALRTP